MSRKIKYLTADVDRHGNTRYYVRRKGSPKIRIRFPIGSQDFWVEYKNAIKGISEPKIQNRTGVYLYIVGEATKPVKIGISSNPYSRLSGLQVGSHRNLKIRCLFKLQTRRDAARLETKLHDAFADKIVRGEWFYATASEVSAVVESISLALGMTAIRTVPRTRSVPLSG